MKLKHLLILITIMIAAGLLSGCSGSAMAASSWPGLTADQDNAYLAYNQYIYAVNLSNGLEKWHFPATADKNIAFYATPVLTADGQLIAGAFNHVLYSIDPATGSENWSFTGATDRYIGSPLVTKDAIYAPTGDGKLFALDFKGNLLWRFNTEDPLWAQPVADPGCECIYVASMDHRIYALDATSGSLEWKTDVLSGSFVGTPAYQADGVLYAGNFGSKMLAIDASNGKKKWEADTKGWVWGGPVLKDQSLYFGDLQGNFYAMNTADGTIDWQIQPDGAIVESPLVISDTVYFTSEAGSLYAVSTSGTMLWSKEVGGSLYTSPVMAGDTLLVAPTGTDNLLAAYDANGNPRWTFIPASTK